MTQWCETCGQQMSGPHAPHDRAPVMLGEESPPSAESKPPQRNQRKLLFAVGGLVAAWLAFVGLAQLASPDDVAEVPYAPVALTATAVAESGVPAPEVAPTPTVIESAAAPEEDDVAIVAPLESEAVPASQVEATQLGARSGPNVRIDRLQRQMEIRDANTIFAYRVEGGIALIDARAATAVVAPITTDGASDPFIASRSALFRTGAETFAIDPVTLRVTLLANDSTVIAATSIPGGPDLVTTIPGEELRNPQPQLSWRWDVPEVTTGEYRGPVNHRMVPIDGVGVLAVADDPGGTTSLAGPYRFETLSEGIVLDANPGGRVESLCSGEPLTAPGVGPGCEVRIVANGPAIESQPPPGFAVLGDQVLLAPDAASLLRWSLGGDADVFLSEEPAVTRVTGTGLDSAAWDPNSTFIVWLDLFGSPELRLLYPAERFWLTVDLADLGLPRPIADDIVAFERVVADEQ